MGEAIKLGNREKLVAAARSCLLERGYGATTVRDLVAESGANQASINYHFGSKDQLLNQALFDLNREWGLVLFEALGFDEAGGRTGSACTDEKSAIALWQRVISSVVENEKLWFVNFESIPYVQHDAEIRKMNAEGQARLRDILAHAFGGPDPDPEHRRIIGSHYYSLLTGLALQLLTDHEHAPTARDVVSADWASRPTAG